MQGYIRIGGIMLAVFFFLGCIYEIVRYWWKIQEKAVRIQPEDGEFLYLMWYYQGQVSTVKYLTPCLSEGIGKNNRFFYDTS